MPIHIGSLLLLRPGNKQQSQRKGIAKKKTN